MGWQVLDNKEKIREIIDHLISKKVSVSIRFNEEKETFTSKLLRFKHGDIASKIGKGPELVIEKLVPERGNSLIQSLPRVILGFLVNKSNCRCPVKYLGISGEYPYFGFFMSVPESIEIEEKRREERTVYNVPDFISVEFTLPDGPQKRKTYALNVIDSSLHGLGVVVNQKDLDLLQRLKPGDPLRNITFYAQTAIIKVDGIVKHITKVEGGRYKGSYVLGIESPEIIESSRQDMG